MADGVAGGSVSSCWFSSIKTLCSLYRTFGLVGTAGSQARPTSTTSTCLRSTFSLQILHAALLQSGTLISTCKIKRRAPFMIYSYLRYTSTHKRMSYLQQKSFSPGPPSVSSSPSLCMAFPSSPMETISLAMVKSKISGHKTSVPTSL